MTIRGTVTISARATNNVGVVGGQFKLGGQIWVRNYFSCLFLTWNTTGVVNGNHITAVARDAKGNQGRSPPLVVKSAVFSNHGAAVANGLGLARNP